MLFIFFVYQLFNCLFDSDSVPLLSHFKAFGNCVVFILLLVYVFIAGRFIRYFAGASLAKNSVPLLIIAAIGIFGTLWLALSSPNIVVRRIALALSLVHEFSVWPGFLEFEKKNKRYNAAVVIGHAAAGIFMIAAFIGWIITHLG